MPDFPLTVTAWSAVILGALYILLTFRVVAGRRRGRIVHGDGDDPVFAKKVRGHANAAEQIPLGLILMGLNEALGPGWVVGVMAGLLIVGRYVHGAYFAFHGLPWQMRMTGMVMTLSAQIIGVAALAVALAST